MFHYPNLEIIKIDLEFQETRCLQFSLYQLLYGLTKFSRRQSDLSNKNKSVQNRLIDPNVSNCFPKNRTHLTYCMCFRVGPVSEPLQYDRRRIRPKIYAGELRSKNGKKRARKPSKSGRGLR